MDGLVSVIMPSYNTGKYIRQTIESVIAQTYTNWELIIVDDCSKDETDSIVRQFLYDNRIKYIKNKTNKGAAVSRNRALREANGKWIAFLDSDDLWKPEKLEKQIAFMRKNGYHFSYTDYSEIDERGRLNGVTVTGPKKITKTGFYNYCWPGCLTVMYDRDFVGLVQIYDIKKNNDYAIWLRVCRKAVCFRLKENLALYRKGRIGSVSSNSIRTMISWHYKLFYEAENQSAIMAVFNTVRNLAFGFYKKLRYVKKEVDMGELSLFKRILFRTGRILIGSKGVWCKKGKKNHIAGGTILYEPCTIGSYNYFAPYTLACNATIGNYCSIGPGCKIGLANHDIHAISTKADINNGSEKMQLFDYDKPTVIESDVWLGANVVVKQGVHIYEGAVIGANAVVTRDIPAYAIAMGIPAKVKAFRFMENDQRRISDSKWYLYEPEDAKKTIRKLKKVLIGENKK